jgi:hemoglobin/transferrin/lactoferrin receptor protein
MMESKRSMLLACTAMSLVFSSAALAQQAQPAEDESAAADEDSANRRGVTYLSPITVGGEAAGDVYTTTAPVSHITADEIEQFGNKNIDDVIRTTPGAATRDNVQNPGVAVNIRGMEGSGRVNMMVDGVRQNFRFTGHEAQGFVYVDPAFLAGIDISRGYVSGVGGGNALMGSANFRTFDIDDLIHGGKSYGGIASVTYGTNHAGWSESAIGAFRFNDAFAVLGGISKRDPGNYENGSGQVVDFTEQDQIAGLFKMEFTPSPEHHLRLGANLYNNDFMANSYYQTIYSRIYTANYAYTPDNSLIDLRINGYYSSLRMLYDRPATTGSAAGRDIRDVGTGFDISNTSRFSLGDVAVRMNYGFEYFADDYDVVNSTLVPDRGVNGPGNSANYSVFSSSQFTYGIADLTLGLRYDHSSLSGEGSIASSNPFGMPGGPFTVDRSEGQFNPSVTLALNPTPWFQPYLTYAHTSRPPTINEVFIGGQHPGMGPPQFFFPNPFLKPEKSRGWEVGANFNFDDLAMAGDRLGVKANYFHNRIEDYIVANFDGGTHFDNVPGTSTVQGLELQAAYDSGRYFGSLAYTYTHSDLPSQVNGFGAQSYLPEHMFTATLGARFFEQRLTLGARAYVVSESYIGEINVAPGDSPYEPGYGLVDLFANYKFDNGLELSANVSNLFNKSYSPALSTAPGGNPIDTGRGRTIFLTAKARF